MKNLEHIPYSLVIDQTQPNNVKALHLLALEQARAYVMHLRTQNADPILIAVAYTRYCELKAKKS